jgi:endonuclease-3 related protein
MGQMLKSGKLEEIYRKLYSRFGPQYWWPGESPFEVMVGTILTQNTSWQNVEQAIANLKKADLLDARKIYGLPHKRLAGLIRPAGYFNVKAKRLKNFVKFYLENYGGSVRKMRAFDTGTLRERLLSVNGIGQETADSILLYALGKPVFVVDAYTKRIYSRHKFFKEFAPYEVIQDFFMQNLKNDVKLFNEYHALIVKLGKDICRKSKPKCAVCPLGKNPAKNDQ